MPTKIATTSNIEASMKELGALIKKCRGGKSGRKLAGDLHIPPSQLLSIENGVLAPTAEVFNNLLTVLNPAPPDSKAMERLYTIIRKVPPPNICNTLLQTPALMEAIRLLDGVTLTPEQEKMILELFNQLTQNKGGYSNNG